MQNTDHARLNMLHEVIVELSQYQEVFQNQKIVFFKPNPKGQQRDFFESSESTVRLVLGSNRSGKTACGAVEAIAHMLGYRPWLPEGHPHRTVRLPDGNPIPVPNVGKVLAQNFEQAVRQTIIPKFEEWCPRAFIKKIEKNTRGIPVAIELINGSIAYFMSNDQDDMAFEGPNHHWVWIDEPCDYRKYTGLKRGLVDFSGHLWMTMTPLSQPWINDVIVSKAGDGTGVDLFKFSIWDNCVENGGHLERAAIESFLSDLREEELEARLHGNFIHLAGRVYKSWEPRAPYWVEPFVLPASWPRLCLADPHGRKPCAVMWAAVSPSNIWYIYRAMFDRNLKTVAGISQVVKQAEKWASESWAGPHAEPVAMRIIDWSAEENELTSGMSIRKKFSEEGLHFVKAKKANAAYGYDAIHEAFDMPNDWSVPGVVVFNTCTPVKHNFMNFCHDQWATSKQEDVKGPKEGYRSVDDDFIDLIRYIFQHKVNYHGLQVLLKNQQNHFDEPDLRPNGAVFHRDGLRTGYSRTE
jgi:hypothetical protein